MVLLVILEEDPHHTGHSSGLEILDRAEEVSSQSACTHIPDQLPARHEADQSLVSQCLSAFLQTTCSLDRQVFGESFLDLS